MSRPSLDLILSLSLFTLCQMCGTATEANAIPSSSPVQVVYVVDGVTIITYNIDPQTLNAVQVGTPITVNGATGSVYLFSSPDDRFLYFTATDANSMRRLWVFPTNSNGVPQSKPTEQLALNRLVQVAVDPEANFAYLVFGYPTKSFKADYFIRRYELNPVTGAIAAPVDEAKYVLPDFDADTCSVAITGFNSAGTTLYDEVDCGTHEGYGATYYERTVNMSTGTVGQDVQIYSFFGSGLSSESVQFVGKYMFDFRNVYPPGNNSVDIYPIVPNTSKPVLVCKAQMLEACGYATGRAHPSGKYVFMNVTQDTTTIDKVDPSAKKIVDTGNYIPYDVVAFSPDGSLAYGILNVDTTYYIEIYGFDVATSAVTPGGSIFVPSGLDSYFIAERR